ncbi:hypothetical protein BDV27DRAFT_164874 [Aspergillus caelatus]|uniref:Uncharacterized protein n=1 Tax=Aspergillus caelatus TaxID=61420 RepID=A0A5N6ZLM1_9EURO|nr:uncharacterized protein BDV27DRAFT_164874 [Aspergillus caelatus]KAE8357080.1 hypothetical protein BDV27DRAFT_164874 [Aspergillus caelatus]
MPRLRSWIEQRSLFWDFCWQYFQLIHEGSFEIVVDETARIDSVPRWFEGVRLNFAENLLFSSDARDRLRGKEDDKVAVVAVREAGAEGQTYVTWKELRSRTGRLVQALKAHGVKCGDPTTALGAIFSSVTTDMGTKGLLDRLSQIKPVWLFMDDFAVYNREKMDLRSKIAEVVKGLDGVVEFQGVVAMPRFSFSRQSQVVSPKLAPCTTFSLRCHMTG